MTVMCYTVFVSSSPFLPRAVATHAELLDRSHGVTRPDACRDASGELMQPDRVSHSPTWTMIVNAYVAVEGTASASVSAARDDSFS